jgi:Protein of unknown function (DUF3072)
VTRDPLRGERRVLDRRHEPDGSRFGERGFGYMRGMANDKASQRPAEKNTEDWVTGDEPMTGPQRSYLETLAREAGEEVGDDLTKAEASERIEQLQRKTDRG